MPHSHSPCPRIVAGCIIVATLCLPRAAAASTAPDWPVEVAKRALPSVVRISGPDGIGAGFVFHSTRNVATAFHVIAAGRSVRVTSHDGQVRRAVTVAVDEAHDLAILELDRAFEGVAPLELRREPVEIGVGVVAIGHPFAPGEGLLAGLKDWSVSVGIVSASTADVIQTDAAVNPGNSGGPLLTDGGEVLGVVSRKEPDGGVGFAVRATLLDPLVSRLGTDRYHGRWARTLGIGLQLVGSDLDTAGHAGLLVEASLIRHDRLAGTLRGGYSGYTDTLTDGSVLATRSRQWSAELELSYRIPLTLSESQTVYVAPGLGVAFIDVESSTSSFALQLADPTCDLAVASCETETTVTTTPISTRSLRPMAALHLMSSYLELAYAFQLDVQDPAASQNRFSVTYRGEF